MCDSSVNNLSLSIFTTNFYDFTRNFTEICEFRNVLYLSRHFEEHLQSLTNLDQQQGAIFKYDAFNTQLSGQNITHQLMIMNYLILMLLHFLITDVA